MIVDIDIICYIILSEILIYMCFYIHYMLCLEAVYLMLLIDVGQLNLGTWSGLRFPEGAVCSAFWEDFLLTPAVKEKLFDFLITVSSNLFHQQGS